MQGRLNSSLVRGWALAAIVSAAACAHVKTITGPDGGQDKLITCPTIEQCYSKATEICGKYKIVNNSTEVVGSMYATTSSTSLLVKCQ